MRGNISWMAWLLLFGLSLANAGELENQKSFAILREYGSPWNKDSSGEFFSSIKAIDSMHEGAKSSEEAEEMRLNLIVGVALPGYTTQQTLNVTDMAAYNALRAASAQQIASVSQQLGVYVSSGDLAGVRQIAALPYFAVNASESGLRALMVNPTVTSVGVDLRFSEALSGSTAQIGSQIPNSFGLTGGGRAVVVIDSGVDATHPFFGSGRIVNGACFSSSSDGLPSICHGGLPSPSVGVNAGRQCQCPPGSSLCTASAVSNCGHGTHVAGIAVGQSAGGMTGVAPSASLISIQASSLRRCLKGDPCRQYLLSDLVSALDWTLSYHLSGSGPKVAAVNMSLRSTDEFSFFTSACDFFPDVKPLAEAANQLRAEGVALIAATGNDRGRVYQVAPACLTTVAGVGSVDRFGQFAEYSNSPGIDFLAPGGASSDKDPINDICSAALPADVVGAVPIALNCASPNASPGTYGRRGGTSMAAPHIAGTVSAIRAFFRDQSGVSLGTVDQVLNLLSSTGQAVWVNPLSSNRPLIRVDNAFNQLASLTNVVASSPQCAPASIMWQLPAAPPEFAPATVQVEESEQFGGGVSIVNVPASLGIRTYSGQFGTSARMRVRACWFGVANCGPWSAFQNVTNACVLPPPTNVRLSAITNCVGAGEGIEWNVVSGATSYQVEEVRLSGSSNFTGTPTSVGITGTYWFPLLHTPGGPGGQGDVSLRVRACVGSTNCSSWAPVGGIVHPMGGDICG